MLTKKMPKKVTAIADKVGEVFSADAVQMAMATATREGKDVEYAKHIYSSMLAFVSTEILAGKLIIKQTDEQRG